MIVPSYGSAEVAEAVVLAGAMPVFVDIDADSFCLDPVAVAAAVTSRTTAVIPVHQFGQLPDLVAIGAVAQRHELRVIEHEEPGTSPAETVRRQANAAFLSARLKNVVTPRVVPGSGHTFEQYVVRVPGNGRPDRDAFAMTLRRKGIRCRVPVQTPVHRMPQFRRDLWLPESERAADECLSLPIDAGLSRRDLSRVVSACNALGGLLQPMAL